MSNSIPKHVIGELRQALAGLKKSEIYKDIIEPRDAVFGRFQPVFSGENAATITADEFRSFLLLENNRHWTGLHRQGPRMTQNMKKLRAALVTLADESQAIDKRLDAAVSSINGMGKNVATGILTIIEPDKYGVWNNRSEAGLKKLGIWPTFKRGDSFGSRYVQVNGILNEIASQIRADLWTLDALWWYIDSQEGESPEPAVTEDMGFGLERHLHDFMRDNWSKLQLGKNWTIYSEPGDEEAGYEYPCKVGRIDLLARHKTKKEWLVIELKRGQTSDQTIGQLLRYVGWVKKELAPKSHTVRGMIVCREADDSLQYALSTIQDVELMTYEVNFQLKAAVIV